jgi:flagellar hook-length control protein FliK
VSSAPSIMSDASAAAPLASQWPQAPAAAEPIDAQPFGAFLDAADTPPPATTQSAGPALQWGPHFGAGASGAQANGTATADAVAPRAKALDGARGTKWRGANTVADRASEPESRTVSVAETPSSANSADSNSSADAPANAEKSAVTQPGTASADSAAAGAAAAATANALALAGAADAAPPANSRIGAGKDGDRDNDATASAGQALAGSGPPQGLAAAFVLSTGAGAAAAFGARAAGDAHGQSLSKLDLSSGGAQNATPADGKNAAPAKSTPATSASSSDNQTSASDGSDGSDGGSGPSGTTANASPPDNAQQQAQVQGADDAALTALNGTFAAGGAGGAGGGDRSTQVTSALAAASAAGGAGPAANAAASAMAISGLAAGNATGTAASTGAADGGVAVPLAGLAIAIAARAQGGTNRFDIRLDPPELGRIDVRLGVDGKGQVTSHVTVDRADTLQLLQSQQSQLQRALEQAGLKTADNGLQFTLRDQSFAGQNNGGSGGGQQSATQLVIPDSDAAPVDTAQIYSRLRLGSGLDIKV